MILLRGRAAAASAALLALAALAGLGAFLVVAVEDEPAPGPTTTTTSTTSTTVGVADLQEAISRQLMRDPDLALTSPEADCVAAEVAVGLGLERLEDLADDPGALTPDEREALLRGVVSCLPPERAEALLGTPTTEPPPASLPDEDI